MAPFHSFADLPLEIRLYVFRWRTKLQTYARYRYLQALINLSWTFSPHRLRFPVADPLMTRQVRLFALYPERSLLANTHVWIIVHHRHGADTVSHHWRAATRLAAVSLLE